MRPQVSGPTDVGFGNYILTAPVDRGSRQAKQKTVAAADEAAANGAAAAADEAAAAANILNVDELMADINTLTRPTNKKAEL